MNTNSYISCNLFLRIVPIKSIYEKYCHILKQIATEFCYAFNGVFFEHTKSPPCHLQGKWIHFSIKVTFSYCFYYAALDISELHTLRWIVGDKSTSDLVYTLDCILGRTEDICIFKKCTKFQGIFSLMYSGSPLMRPPLGNGNLGRIRGVATGKG